MPAARKTIDSNTTGVAVAEETEPKVLPGSPVWYDRDVNSYSDFGGEISTVAAETINASRQNQRGTPTDLDASGGYNIDMNNALTRDMQGFFFADAREKPNTAPYDGTAIAITGVDGSGAYTAASGLNAFPVGAIVLASGFNMSANNGVSSVTAAASGALTTDASTVAETPPPAAAVQQVGFMFNAGDLALTVNGGLAVLTSINNDWANIALNVGEWVFIGGDDAASRYGVGYGYGRVKDVSDAVVTLDEIAWTGGTLAADTGSGKSIEVYAGTFIRNEKDPALVKCRTYQVERTLGSDDDGVQSEYLVGAVANELTLNVPLTDKHSADFGYVALDNEQRTGAQGVKSGAHVALAKQKPYNTSSTVWRLQMTLLDPDTLAPTPLFAYVSDATITINNNASAVKAVGVFGGFDITVGTFQVGGSVTAYFTTVEAVKAIRENKDVSFNVVLAQSNKALVYDIPLLGVSGGRVNVERDAPITVPIENFGAENEEGYTASYTEFPYVPDVAMPTT